MRPLPILILGLFLTTGCGSGDDVLSTDTTPDEGDFSALESDDLSPAANDGDSASSVGISEADHLALLRQVLGVYAGQNFGLELMVLPQISERRYQQIPAIADTFVISCTDGGNASVTGELPVFTQSIWNYNFQSCSDNNNHYEGPLFQRTDSQRVMWSSGFRQVGPGESIRFDGGANFQFKNARGGSTRRVWSTDNLTLELQNESGEFTVSGASTYFETVLPYTAFLNGSFNFSSELTNGQVLSVAVTNDFVYSNLSPDFESFDWFFTDGSLLVTAENGDTLVLNARTGERETVIIEINNQQGQSSKIQPWSDFTDGLVMPIDFQPDYFE